jgi:hypothetical protein
MEWTFQGVREILSDLLSMPTFAQLRTLEEELAKDGIVVPNDFVETATRRDVLKGIHVQFAESRGPSVLLSGWYGSGKSTVLGRICEEFRSGQLRYGQFIVDPLEIRLNEHNTFHRFLESLLESVARLEGGSSLASEVYRSEQRVMDLPAPAVDTTRGIVEALQSMPEARVESVVDYLEALFKSYKRISNNRRLLCLVFDELENITEAAQLPGAKDNKLHRLLRLFLDNAVREYIDHPESLGNPVVATIFSVNERYALEQVGWLRQDTADRCKSVEYDIDLTPNSAELLMKGMYRIYVEQVVTAASAQSNDARLLDWRAQLDTANAISNEHYTSPILQEVHKYVVTRLLAAKPPKLVITRFRAYQVIVSTLLRAWEGSEPIGLAFMLRQADVLRQQLSPYEMGVHINALLDSQTVDSLVRNRFPHLRTGYAHQLGLLSQAAITKSSSPVVSIKHGDIESLTGETPLSENAYLEMLEEVARQPIDGWSVSKDMLTIETGKVLALLAGAGQKTDASALPQRLVRETKPRRSTSTCEEVLRDSVQGEREIQAHTDQHGFLHIRSNRPLVREHVLSVGGDLQTLRRLMSEGDAMRVGVLLSQRQVGQDQGIPFSVTVCLPPEVESASAKYAREVEKAIAEAGHRWDEKFGPLIEVLKTDEGADSFTSFVEALKAIVLLERLPTSDQKAFAAFRIGQPLKTLFVLPLGIEDVRGELVRKRLRYSRAHELDSTRCLIKVLTWMRPDNESLLYSNSDEVQVSLMPKEFGKVHLPTVTVWAQELAAAWADEWFIEGTSIAPYSSWPETVRDMYSNVQTQLTDKGLSFYEAGRVLFGECSLDLPIAQAALHLFFKLGKFTPFGWHLTDSSAEYATMRLVPGVVLVGREKSRLEELIQGFVTDEVLSLVLEQVGAADAESTVTAVLKVKGRLGSVADLGGLEALETELEHKVRHRPAVPTLRYGERTLAIAQGVRPKLGEYLDRLKRVTDQKASLGLIVAHRARNAIAAIETDLRYEAEAHRIRTLLTNWGRAAEGECRADSAVAISAKWYVDGLGKTAAWADTLVIKFENVLADKVRHIRSDHVAEDLTGISDWAWKTADELVAPAVSPAHGPDALETERLRLATLKKEADGEIVQALERVKEALNQVHSAQTKSGVQFNPIDLATHNEKLSRIRSILEQSRINIESVPFGRTLADASAAMKSWNEYYVVANKKSRDIISAWAQNVGLGGRENDIVERVPSVGKTLREIDAESTASGHDLLAEAQQGSEELLLLLAAARLHRYFEERKG